MEAVAAAGVARGGALRHFLVLLLAAAAVSMSYGVTLPLLPALLGRLQVVATAAHTGWLTGAYTLALFACSPLWGALSDRADRRWVVAAGLAGAALSLAAFDAASSLQALYASRILAGAVSAAVLPTVLAYVVETTAPAGRQRRFAWISSATALGFLLGPVAASLASDVPLLTGVSWVAILCAVAGALAFGLPPPVSGMAHPHAASSPSPQADGWIWRSLLLTGLVVFGITVAEVGLTLLLRNVAIYFAICSAVMVLVQLAAYPVLERKVGEHRLVTGALAAMATGLSLLAWPASWTPAVAFVLAAAAIGILIPALAVRISMAAGANQGWAMGRQAAAANLGQAIGAGVTGTLFAAGAGVPFLLAAALLAAGVLIAVHQGQRRAGPLA
ncbi:MFS transporter [Ramlibacter sp. AN1015]|uniref:MFS transporter n=1 Tax=Ramlibacter sp. AN1015 TaxID=3133428 RepID=UPI0030BD3983